MQIPIGPISADTAAGLSDTLKELQQRVPRGRPQVPLANALSGGHFGGQGVTGDTALNLPFFAQITDYDKDTKLYAWEAVISSGSDWVAVDGGRQGSLTQSPAYEANGNVNIALGTVVLMRRGFFLPDPGYWVYTFDLSAEPAVTRAVSSTPNPDTGYYDGFVLRYNFVTQEWDDVEPCWLIDINAV